jgi:hypothetical protein
MASLTLADIARRTSPDTEWPDMHRTIPGSFKESSKRSNWPGVSDVLKRRYQTQSQERADVHARQEKAIANQDKAHDAELDAMDKRHSEENTEE